MSKSEPDSSHRLELWQAEWCPSSRRVRQRLTELELSFSCRQVPVRAEARDNFKAATGHTTIPVLLLDGKALAGEDVIIAHLNEHFPEPAGAEDHRIRARTVRDRELEEACAKNPTP